MFTISNMEWKHLTRRGICSLIVITSIITLCYIANGSNYDRKLNMPFVDTKRWYGLPNNNASNWTRGRRLPAEMQGCDQEDPRLISCIHDHWILHPVNDRLQLRNPNTTHFSQHSQSVFFDDFFQHKTQGFYIECGALDGERLSNSLFFERERDWDGLLIEANPMMFNSLLTKHRHAYMVNTCLSTSKQTAVMNFTLAGGVGGITDHEKLNIHNTHRKLEFAQVQCLPLYSILAALGFPHVDFFSLDIEGAEIPVLETIDFDKVDIDVFLIETGKYAEKTKTIEEMLQLKGYHRVPIPQDRIDMVMSKM